MSKSRWKIDATLPCGCIHKVRRNGSAGEKVDPRPGCATHPMPPSSDEDCSSDNYYDTFVDGRGF